MFVNETYRVLYAAFNQLMLHAKVMAWLDFNPINEFWIHTEVMKNRTDWQFEKLTHLNNEGLPPNIRP